MNKSLISEDRLSVIRKMCNRVKGLPGSIAEFGVYQGGSAKVISECLPDKFFHLFDTFTGIPFKGTGDVHEVGDFSNTSLNDVRNLIGDRNTWYHVGLFPAGYTGASEIFSLVHLDCDQYQSIKDGLEFFWQKITPGGVVIIDDYGWHKCPGVKKAVDEFFDSTIYKIKSDASIQVYIVKE